MVDIDKVRCAHHCPYVWTFDRLNSAINYFYVFSTVQVVCDFCREHLAANKEAYADPRLEVIYEDARAELEKYDGKFDVIIADLADPVFGGPCYQVLFKLENGRVEPQIATLWHMAVKVERMRR